mmetsp:Transcript_115229/g.225989  ORF Transcript_115229/g.225989 Transcript_115229/m.225989 type:complete len:319 (-) Transcript_115229:103-1059(-)
MLPWRCGWLPCLPLLHMVLVRVVIAVLALAYVAVSIAPGAMFGGMRFHRCSLNELTIPVGAVCGLASFSLGKQVRGVIETFEVLGRVAQERGFGEWHSHHTRLPGAVYSLLWLSSVIAYGLHRPPTEIQEVIAVFLFAIFSGAILLLSFGMACVCRTLNKIIDQFCCDVVEDMLVFEIADLWNMTAAVFRMASNSIELCLFALCLIMACVLPLIVLDVVDLEAGVFGSLPAFIVACGVLYLIVMAAAISEKCTRVPALINAISFGPGTSRERQHVVDYINSSAAGFYVFGVRLSTGMVMKFAYGWCVVAVGLITKFNA